MLWRRRRGSRREAGGIGGGFGEATGDLGEDLDAAGFVVGVGHGAFGGGGRDTARERAAEVDDLAELHGGFEAFDAGERAGAEHVFQAYG
jgi:hypothetical protein